MSQPQKLNRRQAIIAGMIAGAGGTHVAWAAEKAKPSRSQFAQPLAQDHVVVARRPTPNLITDDPSLVKLTSGRLFASWTFRGTKGDEHWGNARRFNMARSADEGRTWERLSPLELVDAMPFVHQGALYLVGNGLHMKDIVVTRSDDEGRTWRPVVTLFQGTYWNAPTGIALANGHIYRAMSSPTPEFVFGNTLVVAGNLSRDLLEPGSWRISNPVAYPGTPPALRRDHYPPGVIRNQDWVDHWLEPNVVEVRGRLMVLVRCRIAQYATSNLAAVCDLTDAGQELKLEFSQFQPLPGGQSKFHIIYDPGSRLYWMTTNLCSDSQNSLGLAEKLWSMGFHSGLGNERRFLTLWYAIDALNWFPAGCIAMSRRPLQSFMYAAPLVDGDDLLVLSRSSKDGFNQHDADLITFHRVRDFRSLALPLYPEI